MERHHNKACEQRDVLACGVADALVGPAVTVGGPEVDGIGGGLSVIPLITVSSWYKTVQRAMAGEHPLYPPRSLEPCSSLV